MQQAFLEALQPRLGADARIRAAWLEGSLGRAQADRYSDIDLHLWIEDAALVEFGAGAEAWLAAICPLVLYRLLFDGRMINALSADGLRIDVWLHGGDAPVVDEHKTRVLLDRNQALQTGKRSPAPDPVAIAARLEQQIQEFWRCVSMLPVVIGRDERIVSLQGLVIEVNLLTDVLLLGYGVERDTGVKRLNAYLPPHCRTALEDALALDGLTPESLARSHLRLAALLQREGPALAARHGFAYPEALQRAALRYIAAELALLGLTVDVR
jgi:hypothetical protein